MLEGEKWDGKEKKLENKVFCTIRLRLNRFSHQKVRQFPLTFQCRNLVDLCRQKFMTFQCKKFSITEKCFFPIDSLIFCELNWGEGVFFHLKQYVRVAA